MENAKQGKEKNRRLRFGILSTGTTVVFLAVVIILNVVATILLERYPISVDITPEQIYQVDEKTSNYLKSLDTDITVTVLSTKTDFSAVFDYYGAGSYYNQVDGLLTHLPQYNPRIRVEYLDIDKNPDFVAKYSEENLTAESILVQGEKRYKLLTVQQLFNMSQNPYTGETTIESSKAEETLLGALTFVTGTPVRVAVLTGHNEADLSSTTSAPLGYYLDLNNYELESVSLLSESFRGDYDAMIIAAPTSDYKDEEIRILNDYLYNNGQFGKKLVYLASAQQNPLPKLESFLREEWGVSVGDGYLEDNENNTLTYGDISLLQLQYTDSDYAAVIQDQTGMPMLGIQVRPLTTEFEEKGNRSTTVLLSSSPTAAVHPSKDSGWRYKTAKKAETPAAVLATRTGVYDNKSVESNVVVTTLSLMHECLEFPQHQQYVVNLLDTLTNRDAGIVVLPKSIELASIGLNEMQVRLYGILFAVVVPLICLALGLGIWLHRRHK